MKILRRFYPYIKPHLSLILLSGLLAFPLAALRVGPVPLVKYLVDHVLIGKDQKQLVFFALAVIGLFIINFGVRFVHFYFMKVVISRVNRHVKEDLFKHLVSLSADYFTTQRSGALVSRVGYDVNYLDAGISTINTMIREPVTFLILLGYAFHLNWKLTLVTLLIFPPLAWVFAVTGKLLKRYISRITEANADIYSTTQETVSGIRTVKAFRLEEYVKKHFSERTQNFQKYYLKTAVVEELAHPAVELITAFAIAGVIYFGGAQVITGKMSSGDLLAFFTAFALMMNPIRMMNDVNIKLQQASGAAERIFELLDMKSRIQEIEKPLHVGSFQNQIEFDQVKFFYPDAPERLILDGISFQVGRGKICALVGESGAGKTSLFSLLTRVFDVTQGAIRLDGKDIRHLSLEELRRLFAVVSQDVFLFNDTIEQNIRCGRLDATPEEIRRAAVHAHALDFIESMPDGFQTVIGDRGQKLSGGERQRISIARAFLRESPILLLDEATSSLDSKSERAVQEALDELMVNRTTLIIAHRLSTIQHADEILVMKSGQIVERGTHADLVQRSGIYSALLRQGQAP